MVNGTPGGVNLTRIVAPGVKPPELVEQGVCGEGA